MYVKSTVPLGIGEILGNAIKLYRHAFAKCWRLALFGQVLFAIPASIIRTQFTAVRVAAGDPLAALAALSTPGIWLSYLIAGVLFVGINNALLSRIDGVAMGRVEFLGHSVAVGFRLLPRTVLLFLAMMAAAAIAAMTVAVFAAVFRNVPVAQAVLVGAAAAAGIYAWGRVFLANVALVVEDTGVVKSLEISWNLIKNHWWRIGTAYTIAVVIAMVFYFVIGFLSALAVAGLHGYAGAAAVASQLISIIGGAVLLSFLPAALLAMYYDLKLRKGGVKLAGRVNVPAPR